MNSTASNKKFTTDFNKGSIKSKVIGGVGSFGRVKWKVVSIALQQPLKTSLEMSCCACWGRVLVCCAVGEVCALQIPPYSLDGFNVSTCASLLIPTACQTHTLASLCPPKYLISVLTHNNTTYVSTDRFEIQVMKKKNNLRCYQNVRLHFKFIFSWKKVISPPLIFGIIADRRDHQAAWPHQIFLKNWNLERVYLERQIKFPTTVRDRSRRICSVTHRRYKAQENHY